MCLSVVPVFVYMLGVWQAALIPAQAQCDTGFQYHRFHPIRSFSVPSRVPTVGHLLISATNTLVMSSFSFVDLLTCLSMCKY